MTTSADMGRQFKEQRHETWRAHDAETGAPLGHCFETWALLDRRSLRRPSTGQRVRTADECFRVFAMGPGRMIETRRSFGGEVGKLALRHHGSARAECRMAWIKPS